MVELKGKYNMAIVFTDNIEEGAITQIIELCNQEFISGSNIRIMPDVHKGADIGFVVYTVKLGNIDIDLNKYKLRYEV